MTEYIYKIDEDESDESEVFIGYIRRRSRKLVRCTNCIHYDNCRCEYLDYLYTSPGFFCARGEEN